MHAYRFVQELNRLLRTDVPGLAPEDKARLVARQAEAFATHAGLRDLHLAFVPFVPGRRAIDEAKHPGLGSSEASGLISDIVDDTLVLLFRVTRAGQGIDVPADAHVEATLHWLDRAGESREVLPGWPQTLAPERLGKSADPNAAFAVSLGVAEHFKALSERGSGASQPFGFGAMFFERFRLELALVSDGVTVASDAYDFEVYDDRRFGSLYQRIAERLLPHDVKEQVAAARARTVPTSFHPWFPVLCIGVEKANLYMKAIRTDIATQTRRLSDPSWLLRVGLYLELLTCLGVAEAAKAHLDILEPDERALYETAPEWADIKRRVDVGAWREVWALRHVAFASALGLGDTPIGFGNLLRKRSATLAFLHAHHEDLKHAIELAGPNLVNAQETWQRVFRDAERAVLTLNEQAFPELGYLADAVRNVVLWHRQGALAGLRLIPDIFAGPFGDQDGLFASACRQYRASMNYVARWAADHGLMEFTGAECVPSAVSLLESHVAGERARLERLQKRDGYQGTLDARARADEQAHVAVETLASALGALRIFGSLTRDEIDALARSARPIELGPHERIIVQGNKGSSLFLVHEGELEVITKSDGKERVVAQLGRGAVVGESAFLTGQPRTATVRAADSALVIEVGAAHLRPLVERRPAILDELGALMRGRARDNADEADDPVGLLKSIWNTLFGDART